MKKVLHDPIAPKGKSHQKGPWSFAAPTKDVAHSGSLSMGDRYGTGFRVPVGKESASGLDAGPIPQSSKCFSPDEIFHGEDKRG